MEYRKRFAHSPCATLPQCHAATLVERSDGALVSAWYAGAYERAKDVAIYGASLAPDASEWSERIVFADTPDFSEGNPVLFEFPDGRLWLFYVTMLGDRWDTCQVKYVHSYNGGLTWEAPVQLCPEWGCMTGCKPLLQPDGAILLPIYEERGGAIVLRSEDGGREWTYSNRISTELGVIQPTLAPLSDGTLRMYLRTCEAAGGTLWQSLSLDGGKEWEPPTRVALPNPNARVDLTRLASGRMALAFNDSADQRTPLTLALSEDDGATWPYRYNVECEEGEFSYPTLIQGKDGLLQMVYTWRRTHIAHITCDEDWILHHTKPLPR